MAVLLRLSDALAAFVAFIGKLATWLALPMIAVILFDVVTRRFFVIGSTKLQELEWHLHGVLFLLCLGFAYVRDAHVRIELVRDQLSTSLRAWIEIVGVILFVLPYCLLMLYFGTQFAERSWNQNEISSALTGLSNRWIIKSVIPIGFLLLLAAGVSILLRCVVFLFGPARLKEEAGTFVNLSDPIDVDRDIL